MNTVIICRTMGTKTLAFIMVLCSSLGVHYTIRGREYFKQELQWDEQFKLMNKPSVKTFKVNYFFCVIRYHQHQAIPDKHLLGANTIILTFSY